MINARLASVDPVVEAGIEDQVEERSGVVGVGVNDRTPQTLIKRASKLLAVGMSRDGDQRAVYAILTWEHGTWQVEHRRVAYDIQAVARDYVAVGFPNAKQAAQQLLEARGMSF
jgi:hypothetical protein